MAIIKKVELCSAILAASIIAAGCSSSSSSSNQGPITQLGFFTLEEFDGGAFGSSFAVAGFLDLSGDIAPLLPFFETFSSDRCIVNGELTAEQEEASRLIDDAPTISAGDALVLSSPLGTFATLEKREVDNADIVYTPATMLENFPAELTLDIPGDIFPAFSNVAIPESVSIEDFNYAVDGLTDTSEFTWTPTGAANTHVYLEMSFGTTLITCEAVDDGNFSLPAEVVAQTGPLTDGAVLYASADSNMFVQSGNALLQVQRIKDIPLLEQ